VSATRVTSRALLANMVSGVSKGFSRNLAIEGTGFRAALDGKVLVLQLGLPLVPLCRESVPELVP
jgi:ribosomal protein L6P/L9E